MTALHKLFPIIDEQTAVDHYEGTKNASIRDLEVTRARIPLDALVFAEYQTPCTNIEDFRTKRCTYDPETNDWLEFYIRDMARGVDVIPPILVRVTETGLELIDGWHRTTALLIFTDRHDIDALVIT